ncbi:MAG: hypothetical protein JWN52_3454 [Actinomycetia bacterium]|nr:hypothetical protein [Actinomycetes bacterium]
MLLKNKIAVITGAGPGLGRTLAVPGLPCAGRPLPRDLDGRQFFRQTRTRFGIAIVHRTAAPQRIGMMNMALASMVGLPSGPKTKAST